MQMVQRYYTRQNSEEVANRLWDAAMDLEADKEVCPTLLLDAAEVIWDQQRALRAATEVRDAADKLKKLLTKVNKCPPSSTPSTKG